MESRRVYTESDDHHIHNTITQTIPPNAALSSLSLQAFEQKVSALTVKRESKEENVWQIGFP